MGAVKHLVHALAHSRWLEIEKSQFCFMLQRVCTSLLIKLHWLCTNVGPFLDSCLTMCVQGLYVGLVNAINTVWRAGYKTFAVIFGNSARAELSNNLDYSCIKSHQMHLERI